MEMNLDMNEIIKEEMSKMVVNLIKKVVMHCGVVNNFDGERMLKSLNLCDMLSDSLSSKKKSKKEKTVGVGVGVSVSVDSDVDVKKVPLPFDGKEKEDCCRALRQNHGLYTQCETKVDKESRYCKKCEKNQKFGTIEERIAVGVMEFRDRNGKGPTSFVKVMKKLGLSRIEVEIEASKLGVKIDECHFEEEKTEKKEKGRPKKARKTVVLEDDSTDLFAALVAKANEESSSEEESSITGMIDKMIDNSCIIGESNELEIKKKEEAKQEEIKKKAEKEAIKQAAKQEEIKKKEAAKQEEIKKKEEAKQAEIQKKAEKEAAKQAEKEKKETAKAEKKVSVKQTDNQASEKKSPKKETKKAKEDVVSVDAAPEIVNEEEEEDIVKRFEYEGVKYLKSKKTGIIYNMDQDVIGKWNAKTNKIDFDEADSEEEEEEYDE